MVFILLSVLFNAFILMLVLLLLGACLGYHGWLVTYLPYFLLAGVTFISATSFSNRILKWLIAGQEPNLQQKERIANILNDVLSKANLAYLQNYQINQIYLISKQNLPVIALGYETIAIDLATFEQSNDKQLYMLLLKAVQQIHLGIGAKNIALVFSSSCLRLLDYVSIAKIRILQNLEKQFLDKPQLKKWLSKSVVVLFYFFDIMQKYAAKLFTYSQQKIDSSMLVDISEFISVSNYNQKNNIQNETDSLAFVKKYKIKLAMTLFLGFVIWNTVMAVAINIVNSRAKINSNIALNLELNSQAALIMSKDIDDIQKAKDVLFNKSDQKMIAPNQIIEVHPDTSVRESIILVPATEVTNESQINNHPVTNTKSDDKSINKKDDNTELDNIIDNTEKSN